MTVAKRADLAGIERVVVAKVLTPDDAATFARCISVGGVAVFPADTVYGLACEPDLDDAVERLYRLKGRRPDKPAAVMFFALDLALEALPELGDATREAVERLLPGPVHGAAPEPGGALPARVRAGPHDARAARAGAAAGGSVALEAVRWPVLQSSANRAGGAGREAGGGRPGADPRRRRPRPRRRRAARHAVDGRRPAAVRAGSRLA